MRIKIDLADKTFSQFIRLRDKECLRCHSKVEINDKGSPASHECSHFHSRGHEGTRYSPENCITLCFACHNLWGGDRHDEYKKFMIKKLGWNEFKILDFQAHHYKKKDRKISLLVAKELLRSVQKL